MIFQSTISAGPGLGARALKSTMESLSFLTRQYFEPRVICANPGGTCDRIVDTIRFLERNFEREEKMMDRIDYPERVRHKMEHDALLQKLIRMQHAFVCGGYDNAILLTLIDRWQMSHIRAYDEPLGKYLRKCDLEYADANEG